MTATSDRFSNRVENYVKYRPDYPREVVIFLNEHVGLTPTSVVADIGCGPGISSKIFLANGNRVIGVEPNAAMRAAALEYLAKFDDYELIDGTAEETTLADNSVDLVVAAQAFHWFDSTRARAEFQRILKPGGQVALMWNERQLDTTPFLIEYEALLLNYAIDYQKVRHENVDKLKLREFFGGDFESVTFQNVQIFDFAGLKGRLLSSSYMPSEADSTYEKMIAELRILFAKHNENGRIRVFYDTNVYCSITLKYDG